MSTKETSKTTRALNEAERRRTCEVAKALIMGFNWSATPQGADYWSHIHDELEALGKEPPAPVPCKTCGHVAEQQADTTDHGRLGG